MFLTPIRSLGACEAIIAVAFGIYPDKIPFQNRMIKSQYAFGTKAKDPIVNVIPAAARIIMSFRPFRSARFPQIGATTADAKAVTEIASPENNSI